MDHDDDGETSYNTFVDDVAFEPTYLQALLTAAGRNVATIPQRIMRPSIARASEFNWTRGAACRHTTVPISYTRPSTRSP